MKINSDGKKLPECSDYLKNPSKENASELLSELLEQSADMIANKEILVKYVAERPGVEKLGKHGLFSDSDDEIVLSQAQKNVSEHQGNVWSHVISLTREDAERLGYTTPEMWRNLIMRHTDDIAKAQNIRLENMRWYAAFHNTAHHPHIHLLVYSTDIKEGFLTENGIEQIKSALANDIFHNELYQVYEKQTAVRDKLRSEAESVIEDLLSELQNGNFNNPQIEQLVLKLQQQLNNFKGKKVYGYLQPNIKKTVDQIVSLLAQNPVLKKMYDEWCKLEQLKYETYTSAVQKFPSLEENKVFKPIKNAVIRAVLEMDFLEQNIETEMILDDEILLSEDFEDNELHEDIFCDSYHMNWRGNYRTARDFLDDKQYEKAFEMFQKEAAKGNVPAIYSIAKMYRRGLLGKENIPKAREYFVKTLKGFLALEPSAGKMQPYIWYHLGRLYNFGYGTEQDYTEAFKWFEKAAGAGNHYAQYSLGKIYFFGNGLDRDIDMARQWLTLSAEAGNEYAKALIEHMESYNQTAARNAVLSMFLSFGRLISDDYNRSLHGQKLRSEHKLKAAIRRKKQALGLKENPLENPQFK